jgi:hypothetical protein
MFETNNYFYLQLWTQKRPFWMVFLKLGVLLSTCLLIASSLVFNWYQRVRELGLLKSCFYLRCFFFVALRALFRVLTRVFFQTNWRQTSHQKDQRRGRALTRWLLLLGEKVDRQCADKSQVSGFCYRITTLFHLHLYCFLPHSFSSFLKT